MQGHEQVKVSLSKQTYFILECCIWATPKPVSASKKPDDNPDIVVPITMDKFDDLANVTWPFICLDQDTIIQMILHAMPSYTKMYFCRLRTFIKLFSYLAYGTIIRWQFSCGGGQCIHVDIRECSVAVIPQVPRLHRQNRLTAAVRLIPVKVVMWSDVCEGLIGLDVMCINFADDMF